MIRTMLSATVLAVGISAGIALPARATTDWTAVERTLMRKAAVQGMVHRFGFPRTDLTVVLDGVTLKPALALGSWVAFEDTGADAMVMGDLVLTEEEVSPVMKRLVEHGFEVTALHNHLLRARPATFYMHVAAHGDPAQLAEALRSALQESRTPLTPPAGGAAAPLDLDTAGLDGIIGHPGKANDGVYGFSIGRADSVANDGIAVPGPLGTGTAINFQPTGGGTAAITGDFVLTAAEVNPVLRALRDNGIEVTALHNHMLDDQPRLFFMHFWAHDDAAKLARGLRAALDRINLAPS